MRRPLRPHARVGLPDQDGHSLHVVVYRLAADVDSRETGEVQLQVRLLESTSHCPLVDLPNIIAATHPVAALMVTVTDVHSVGEAGRG